MHKIAVVEDPQAPPEATPEATAAPPPADTLKAAKAAARKAITEKQGTATPVKSTKINRSKIIREFIQARPRQSNAWVQQQVNELGVECSLQLVHQVRQKMAFAEALKANHVKAAYQPAPRKKRAEKFSKPKPAPAPAPALAGLAAAEPQPAPAQVSLAAIDWGAVGNTIWAAEVFAKSCGGWENATQMLPELRALLERRK